MSGWDTSSRPSWDQPDGPEESTPGFSAPDLAADDPWPAPAAAAGSPPPEFFPDYGQQESARPGFGQEPDLFRRGRHHAAAPNAYGQDTAFGQDNDYGQDPAYGQDTAFGQDTAYGRDTGHAQETRFGQDRAYGRDTAYNADPYGLETTRQNPRLRQDSAKTGWSWVRPTGPGSAPWDDEARPDPGQEPARPRFDPVEPRFEPSEPRFEPSEPRFDAPEPGRRDAGRSGFDDPETGFRGAGRHEPGRPEVSDDFSHRDGDEGRSGWGQQTPSGTGRREREAAARMDPALQDFFTPQESRPGVPPSGTGRRQPGATLPGSGLPRPAQPRPGLSRPGQLQPGQLQPGQPQPGQPQPGQPQPGQPQPGQPQPGQPQPGQPRQGLPRQGLPGGPGGRGAPAGNGRRSLTDGWPAVNGRRSRTDDWDAPADAPAGPPRRGDTRPPQRTPGRGSAFGGGLVRNIAIIAVAVVVVVVCVVFLTRKHGSTNSDANKLPTATHTAAKAVKPTASPTPSGPVYTLSTPDTAGGFPIGQDPDFLATATTTAHSIVSAVSSGGGGTVKGNPVSASYQLPTDEQTMEFVGYQGTFDPAKVATILASLGSDPNSYPAGPDGGILGCANTTSAPNGGVCVWATTSTLGIVEFFEGTGPETLVTAQAKGAAAVLSLRSGVETKKS